MTSRWLILIMAALLLLPLAAAGADLIDDDPEAVTMYARGKRLLRQGDWYDAARLFEELAGRFPNSPNLDRFVFHRAKAEYYFGEFSEAAAGFSYYLNKYSQSPEAPYAEFFLANANYRRGYVNRAMEAYLRAYAGSRDGRLDELVVDALRASVEQASAVSLDPGRMESLPREKRCRLARELAAALAAKGEADQAARLARLCPDSTGRRQLPDGTLPESGSGKIKIGIVLPFSGELQNYAEDIYNGCVVAADLFAQQRGRSVELSRHDTRGEPIDAARTAAELARGYAVHAAVGPLTSEEAAVTAAALSCHDLPLVIPAATGAGLTQLAESAFQLSPNVELEGIRMAEYAIDSLGADSAAVITSTVPEHMRQARAFADRFEQLGGTVIGTEYYRARDMDFGPYVKDLKAMIHGMHPDSMVFINEDGDTLHPDGVMAEIDCLYLPGNAQQLKLLLPQVYFYKVLGYYLGSDGWGDETVYRLGENITDRVIFPSPFLTGETGPGFVAFATAYDERYGERPSRLAALGYDAVTLLAGAVAGGGSGRAEIVRRLARVNGYQGASGNVTFGSARENVEMPLFRIEGERAVPLASGVTAPGEASVTPVSD